MTYTDFIDSTYNIYTFKTPKAIKIEDSQVSYFKYFSKLMIYKENPNKPKYQSQANLSAYV